MHLLRRPGKLGLGSAYLAGFRHGLDRGFDVALIEYRPRDVATWPGPEDDVAAALELLAETRDIAVVVGHSAGATLAVQACERSRTARACVAVAPVPDMAAGFAAFMSEAVIHAWTFACMWGHRTGRL